MYYPQEILKLSHLTSERIKYEIYEHMVTISIIHLAQLSAIRNCTRLGMPLTVTYQYNRLMEICFLFQLSSIHEKNQSPQDVLVDS